MDAGGSTQRGELNFPLGEGIWVHSPTPNPGDSWFPPRRPGVESGPGNHTLRNRTEFSYSSEHARRRILVHGMYPGCFLTTKMFSLKLSRTSMYTVCHEECFENGNTICQGQDIWFQSHREHALSLEAWGWKGSSVLEVFCTLSFFPSAPYTDFFYPEDIFIYPWYLLQRWISRISQELCVASVCQDQGYHSVSSCYTQ